MTGESARKAGERGPIVFMVQEPRMRDPATGGWRVMNTTSALDFGSVEVLLETGAQVMFDAAPTVARLRAKLIDYRDGDFIVAAGDPVAIGVACAIAAAVNEGRFTILKWDNQERRYFPVYIFVPPHPKEAPCPCR